jgi:hypothetical protein
MFNKMVVQNALKNSFKSDANAKWESDAPADGEGSLTSLLIYDIFGGEILKTHKEKGLHFYNRIDGERIDFTGPSDTTSEKNQFEDLPSSPDETYKYFEQEEYSTLFLRFIRAYENAVGLNKYISSVSA